MPAAVTAVYPVPVEFLYRDELVLGLSCDLSAPFCVAPCRARGRAKLRLLSYDLSASSCVAPCRVHGRGTLRLLSYDLPASSFVAPCRVRGRAWLIRDRFFGAHAKMQDALEVEYDFMESLMADAERKFVRAPLLDDGFIVTQTQEL